MRLLPSGFIMATTALLEKPQPDRRRHRRGDHQPLPVRHLPAMRAAIKARPSSRTEGGA